MAEALLARAQPDNWKVSGIDFVTNWIQAHIATAASLGKPLIIEEVRSWSTALTCINLTCISLPISMPLRQHLSTAPFHTTDARDATYAR